MRGTTQAPKAKSEATDLEGVTGEQDTAKETEKPWPGWLQEGEFLEEGVYSVRCCKKGNWENSKNCLLVVTKEESEDQ